MDTKSTSEPIGLSLLSRGPSVTVHRRISESDDTDPERGQSSLDGTRRYYNADSTLSPSTSTSSSRPLSLSRTTIRASASAPSSTSHGEPTSRPPSTTPSESTHHSARSPTRTSVPLPTPRGFLSPQKPAAARRLEQKERAAAAVRQSLSLEPVTVEEIETGSQVAVGGGSLHPSLWQPVAEEPQHESEASHTQHDRELTQPPHSPFSDEQSEHTGGNSGPGLAPAPSRELANGRGTIGSIVTDGSSLRRQPPPETSSSDHLMDFNAIVEKGPGGVQASSTTNTIQHPHPLPPVPAARTRKYQHLASNSSTKFFFAGHGMTGGDSPLSLIISLVVLFGVTGVWLGTTGAWLCTHGTEYGMAKGGGIAVVVVFLYMWGITVSSMIAAAFRDPGILPRNLDLDPPYSQVESWWEAVPREVRVGDTRMTVKYCETCKIYRPPRCSHCRVCGNCVDGIDHHCSYLHSCVGKRNYFPFLVYVVFVAISDIYVVVFSAIHFSMLCHHDSVSFRTALGDSPGAAVSFALGVLSLPPVLFLLQYHLRLLVWNLTTIEKIRASASKNLFRANKRPDNPFTHQSLLVNMVRASFGRPQVPSWIDPSGWYIPDKRKVNPALTSPEKYIQLV